MRTAFLCSILFLLAACNGPAGTATTTEPSIENSTAEMLQCSKDIDCKGDRICEKGVCTSPSPLAVTATAAAAAIEASPAQAKKAAKALTQQEIDTCAMKKIDAYRAEVGPDEYGDEAVVSADMIGQSEAECKAGI